HHLAGLRIALGPQRIGQSCAILPRSWSGSACPPRGGPTGPGPSVLGPRVMALAGTRCALAPRCHFTNRSPCARVSPPLHGLYTSAQMIHDLRRLRLKGLLRRVPHQPLGAHARRLRWAVFYTKLHDRLLGALLDADEPHEPVEL